MKFRIYPLADLDDESPNSVTSWSVESKSFNQEYQEYGRALDNFNDLSRSQTIVILFEIKRKRSDGSIIKKTPLLNSRRSKETPSKHVDKQIRSENARKSTGRFANLKLRLLVLALVLIVFLIMIYVFNTITTGPSGSSTSHHFLLTEMIAKMSLDS
jgi:hypothetical protein